MHAFPRNIETKILDDLTRKMVLLSGPRQVGKTTLARALIQKIKGRYLLFDDPEDRREILEKRYLQEKWVCLDEFHKFARWKHYLKGVHDKHRDNLHLLVTGSARLEVYQKSGDSLLGRYYALHLHPLSLGELHGTDVSHLPSDVREPHKSQAGLPELLKFGGFPEPFALQSEEEHRRWSTSRRTLLIHEDLRELTEIKLITLVEQLMLLLPQRIGSTFSYRSLAGDIQVGTPTVQNWMNVLEQLYLVFRLSPYSKKIARSLRQQPKYYFWDWSQVPDDGARFENLVASHLWKAIQLWNDFGLADLSLHFVRDRDQREVDFLIVKDGQPWFFVETKLADTTASPILIHFANKFGIPAIQLVARSGVHKKEGPVSIISADQWLGILP